MVANCLSFQAKDKNLGCTTTSATHQKMLWMLGNHSVKIQEICSSEILREIIFSKFKLPMLEALNFGYDFMQFFRVEILQKSKSRGQEEVLCSPKLISRKF